MTAGTYRSILEQQQAWAERAGVPVDDHGYVGCVDDNLYRPLRPETRAEFLKGRGSELGEHRGRLPAMYALHSSAALACNVFDRWRGGDLRPIAAALGADPESTTLRFEAAHRTPFGGVPPHLDVEFGGPGARPTAIVAKFTEPYRHRGRAIKDAYCDDVLWLSRGLAGCAALARALAAGTERFRALDANQVLAHILGLTRDYGRRGFRLLYLWHEVPGPEAEAHLAELGRFAGHMVGTITFEAMSYQTLFERLRTTRQCDDDYLRYLVERYGSGVSP